MSRLELVFGALDSIPRLSTRQPQKQEARRATREHRVANGNRFKSTNPSLLSMAGREVFQWPARREDENCQRQSIVDMCVT